ncbi:hypothetical protein Anas_03837 [Armadillidium nasatum]|uniref:EF-hand domain-containing protein n=1 Tax=Armadillidium nasatum TaxID=96803 RepID=A0A5N5T6E9_9CRUS|nr:hypothetical protein Anas_03837 [Armadillidium nasatum]
MSVYRCLYSAIRCQNSLRNIAIPACSLLNTNLSPAEEKIQNYGHFQQVTIRNYGKHSPKGGKPSSSSSSSTDSDSDKRVKKDGRGQTQFWRHKMRTHHTAIDLNNDGVVSWDDFEELINRQQLRLSKQST